MRKPVRIGITGVVANATYTSEPSPELEQLVTKLAEKAYYQTSKTMNKKYVKVQYKDLVPGKEYIQIHPIMIKNMKDERKGFPEPEWVEEVPDHSENMLSLLQQFIYEFEQGENSFNTVLEAKKIINRIKCNES